MPIEEKSASIWKLVEWFKREKRSFPWRKISSSPYSVWVSEVMLQQTRADVVIPYFLRWMELFPSIESLASADEGTVLKAWEGLGYYARARRLWQGAKFLRANNKAELPSTYEELLEIPGFGPYTAGAVISFAFHKRAAAVDGNVTRVIARLFAIEDFVEKSGVQQQIREMVLGILPEKEPWVAMEAFIELGALICKKKPECALCPLENVCEAKRLGLVENLPKKKPSPSIQFLERDVVILQHKEEILVRKVQEGQVMAGLYEFPYFEKGISPLEETLKTWIPSLGNCQGVLDPVDHTFTRFRARLYPSLWECSVKQVVEGFIWVPLDQLMALPFSSGHRRIIGLFEETLCQN